MNRDQINALAEYLRRSAIWYATDLHKYGIRVCIYGERPASCYYDPCRTFSKLLAGESMWYKRYN